MRASALLSLLALPFATAASPTDAPDTAAPACVHTAQEQTEVRASCEVAPHSLLVAIDACWKLDVCASHDWAELRVWACSAAPGALHLTRARGSALEPAIAPIRLTLGTSSREGCPFAAYWRDLSEDDPTQDVSYNAITVTATLVPDAGPALTMVVVDTFSG